MMSSPCNDRKSANILPVVSVLELCRNSCLLFASIPQTRFVGFILSTNVCMVVRSLSRSRRREVGAGNINGGICDCCHNCVVLVGVLIQEYEVMFYALFDKD